MTRTSRLDVALVERGLARSRSRAAELIKAGSVLVNGRPALRPAQPVADGDAVDLAEPDRYVSRAAHKLIGALEASGVAVPERVLDAGASTGGFTQVLLERGATRVYAIDVGHGQLAPDLRGDERVVVREGLNLRDLTLEDVEGRPVPLIVADLSFISLRLVLGPLASVLAPDGVALLLVKPQFEVGRGGLDDHGVVRSEAARRQAVDAVLATGTALGLRTIWQGESALRGAGGNVEHFVALARQRVVGAGE